MNPSAIQTIQNTDTNQTAMMKSPGQDDKLQRQFEHLQRDWISYNRSNPHRLHPRHACGLKASGPTDIIQLMDASPRKLISSLQQNHSPSNGWKVRTNDLAVEEIMRDRRAAIESGRLKGRRLFNESDGGDELGFHGKEEICSASTSVLIQGSEVGPSCSYSSSSCDDDDDDDDGFSCCLCMGNVEGEKVVSEGVKVGGVYDGGRWMVRMSWLGLVLVVFALGIISWKGFDGKEEIGEGFIPT